MASLACFTIDVVVVLAALCLSTVLLRGDIRASLSSVAGAYLIWVSLFGIASLVVGAYRRRVIADRFDAAYFAFIGIVIASVVQWTAITSFPSVMGTVTRREVVLGSVMAAVLLCVWRYYAGSLAGRFKSFRQHFYVVGDPEEGKRIVTGIKKRHGEIDAEYMPVETFRDMTEKSIGDSGGKPLPVDIIITLNGREHLDLTGLVLLSDKHYRRTYAHPSLQNALMFHERRIKSIGGIPLIQVAGEPPRTPYSYVKPVLDFVIAAIGVMLFLPVGVAAAIAVRLSSPGPVFYLQERLGKDGHPFKIIKFRSMRFDGGDGNDYVRAEKNDARVTRVGRFIRKYKIDELPQLINVLKGDMSLIGPRPLWKDFFYQDSDALPLWRRRLAVRPGVTSLCHVLGSSDAAPADFLRYDLTYVSSLSFSTDLKILLGTVRVVLSGKSN